MLAESAPLEAHTADLPSSYGHPAWVVVVGWVAIVWYLVVTLVCWLGNFQLQRHYSKPPRKAISTTTLPHSKIPHVTIIRPVKGLEPFLYDCLAASIRQDYPRDKLTVYFCVTSTQDPAYPVLERILQDFPDADARVFVEPPYNDDQLGPNPKIRNMSQAYREAKGDIVWITDCNVWLSKGVCGRMVDRLCGFDQKKNGGRRFKFVHHLPIVVDVPDHGNAGTSSQFAMLNYGTLKNVDTQDRACSKITSVLSRGGGRLEEIFLSSSHAKMYSAINTVLIAPCIIGKSSMFRRSHLNYLTTTPPTNSKRPKRRPGIDYFSDNICEDHLIGDRLWKGKIFEEAEHNEDWGKHSLMFGDLAIQPMSGMSVGSYIDRRVRWLRVRKFTVLLATLVEPGTESFLCSAYLAFGLTTSVPCLLPQYRSYLANWSAFCLIWVASVLVWMLVDWSVYLKLHSGATIEADEFTPPFARPLRKSSIARRPFREWLFAWLGREALALPIWIWSFYGGTTVVWRDKVFRVGMDMVAYEIAQLAGGNKIIQTRSRATSRQGHEGCGDGSSNVRRRTPNGSFVSSGLATARVIESEIGKS
ncbi:ceramide glucosyltransferase [Coccidioides immitis RS]|uniref:Ceramide glucosyltransferase n=2 Tax=Coccidioides immitis TaxID=5501 RepID=J3K8I2_COCIM|nr:ceramide glucosyltransferase [Coccidioides immitis RS]EAS31132.3 ceramide glucosyltransferase [Coccidioides immitis RS]KMP03741.1 ceramide glucosyltransferase [Coccidioides immitis RMSCC 2394]TPX23983.1 hypothetical protein DIZ76_013326 [Coccidioides immitis]